MTSFWGKAMPTRQDRFRIAVLDDYQDVALSLADWSVLDARAMVTGLTPPAALMTEGRRFPYRGFPSTSTANFAKLVLPKSATCEPRKRPCR